MAAIHGRDLGAGCVGAERANVLLITGDYVSEKVGFEEAAWVEFCSLDEGLADGICVMGWWGLMLSWERRHSWKP